MGTKLLVPTWKSASPVRHPGHSGVVRQEDAQDRVDIFRARGIVASVIRADDDGIRRSTAILERPSRAYPDGQRSLAATSTGCVRGLRGKRNLALHRQMDEYANGERARGVAPLGNPAGPLGLEIFCMHRRLIWIEKPSFQGSGCSECSWVFKPSGPPAGDSLDEMKKNFERMRDIEFANHSCAAHPKARKARV